MHKKLIVSSIAAMLACGAGTALAAAPDWGKVPSKKITVFYPGVSPIEWITKGTDHSGAKGLKKGESCAACHDGEATMLRLEGSEGSVHAARRQLGEQFYNNPKYAEFLTANFTN